MLSLPSVVTFLILLFISDRLGLMNVSLFVSHLSPCLPPRVQDLSSQCWKSCCLSPRSRTIPAGWSSRQRTAVPAKCGNWCRNILTRLVQHCFSLLQSTACSKNAIHQHTTRRGVGYSRPRVIVALDTEEDWNKTVMLHSVC